MGLYMQLPHSASAEQKIFIDGPVGRLEVRLSAQLLEFIEKKASSELTEEKGYHPPLEDNPLRVGVVCHPHPLFQGTMDNKVVTTLTRTFRDLGMATLRFNFRGVGESEGEYANGIGEIEDLRAILQFLAKVSPNIELWLGGFSFGAMVSIQMALVYATNIVNADLPNLQGLISIAPAVQFLDSLDFFHPHCPWLIIQGGQDEIVPIKSVKDWYYQLEKHPGLSQSDTTQLIILPKATHFFHGHLQEIKETVARFILSNR